MLAGIFAILLFQLFGEVIQKYFALVIPGPVIGLTLMLCFLLVTDRFQSNHVTAFKRNITLSAEGILGYLSLLFVPIGVGVILHLQLLDDILVKILGVIIIGTVLTMLFTAFIFAQLKRVFGSDSSQ